MKRKDVLFNTETGRLERAGAHTESGYREVVIEGGGSGGGVTNITYAALVTAIGASGLTAGAQYKITDYATKHYIVDSSGTQHLDSIITGANEPLIVTASSSNTLEPVAYSALHPEDIIHYDFNPANWINDPSFADLTGETPVIVTGFKGVIYFRHDTLLDNYMGYDFRNCKFRRWKTNVAAWNEIPDTTYAAASYVLYLNKVYRALKGGSTNQTPASGSDWWVTVLDLTLSEYWMTSPDGILNIPVGSDYIDTKTFTENGAATYEFCCRGNHFASFKDDNVNYYYTGTLLSNNVFYLSEAYPYVQANKFGLISYANTVYGSFAENNFGNVIHNNIFWAAGTNTCINSGVEFGNNIIINTLSLYAENHFGHNIIGQGSSGNIYGNGFANNVLGESAVSNSFETSFGDSVIGNNFKLNHISDNVGFVDFTSATHVYAAYNTTIFSRVDGTAKLSYCDNSDVIQVVNANA